MRSYVLATAAALPTALACSNPDTDSCAGAYTDNAALATSFCATWTAGTFTATSAVPSALGEACGYKTKKLSTACACYVTGGAAATTATATTVKTTAATSAPTTLATSIKQATTSTVAKTSTSVKTSSAKTATASVSKTTVATTTAPAGNACTVTAYAGISSAVKSCTNIVLDNISVPASSTLDLQSLQTGTTVTFSGTTEFGTTANSDFDPIVISGTDVTITGASGHVINGNGASYWDGKGSNGGSDKPDHFIVLKKMYNSRVTNLNIKDWPTHCFYISGNVGLTMTGLTLDNSDGDASNSKSGGDPAAHNTDGFDISGSDTVTLDSITVHNQDDCVAVTSGSNIVVSNMYCSGGHGLSIGSIGGKSNNTVVGVTFQDSVIVNSENGCRIKSNYDTTGTVENVTYKNITLSGISDYGIDVQQDYENGGATGKPSNGVTISGITFDTVTGTVSDDSAYDYYILCGDGSCSDFTFTDVSITGGKESCNYPSSGCP